MRILIAAPTYLPAKRANTIQVMKMAQAMHKLGNNVRVLVPNPERKDVVSWDELSSHYGLHHEFEVSWLPVNPSLRSYDYGFKIIFSYRGWNADILYTRSPQAAAFASIMGFPTIFEVHDLPGGLMNPWLTRRFLFGKGARRFVLISRSLKDAINSEITSLLEEPFTIVAPDGVDLERYDAIPDSESARRWLKANSIPKMPTAHFTVGYSGHFYAGRGIALILAVASRTPEFTFLLIGGDPESITRVRQLVEDQSLQNVILTGFVPNADLPVYQAACDVLLMPYQERVAASSGGNIAHYLSPMKMFEYLACGRVIFSSDLPVLREVLNDQNAVLLPPDDVNAWVEALRDLKSDPNRRHKLADQAKEDARRYTWDSRAALLLSEGQATGL
jgi:glycosyltransferase involved in cell wall biosynthesis